MSTKLRCVFFAFSFVFSLFCVCSCVTPVKSRELANDYYMLAKGYAEQKNFDKATIYYKRAMQHGSVAIAASYELARVYSLAGDYDNAYKVLTQLSAEEADNGKIISAMAYILAVRGEYNEALKKYAILRERNLLELTSSRNYCALLYVSKDWTTALDIITPLLTIYPEDNGLLRISVLSSLQLNIADKEKETEATEKAQKYLAIQGNSQDVDVLSLLGQSFSNQKFYYKALESYEAIPQEKRTTEILLEVSSIYLSKIDDSTKGIGFLEDALKLGYRDEKAFKEMCGNISTEKLGEISDLFFQYKANDAQKKEENQ